MADDAELDYAFLAQHAMRGVVRDVLTTTKELGSPPGDHHFYIEFMTSGPGVTISKMLKAQYPERMTIVLQHQFENLEVYPDRFEVTLHFKGMPDRLIIPFDAVVQFADPSVNFALQFPIPDTMDMAPSAEGTDPGHADPVPLRRPGKTADDADDNGPDGDGDGDGDGNDDGPGPRGNDGSQQTTADVVSIDRFRKK